MLELIGLQLEDAADLIGQRARPSLRRVVAREQQQVLHDARRPGGLVGDDRESAADVRRHFRTLQQQVGLAEDRRQRIVDLVGDPGGQLADGGELLGVDQLGLRAAQLLEAVHRLRVEARVVERDTDLVGGRLHQRHLALAERLAGLAAERQRAQDAAAAVDRHAHESLDVVLAHRVLGRRQQVRRLGDVAERRGLPGGGHAADQAEAERQHPVDLAQLGREAAVAAQVQRLPVLREQMEAGDLVAGDVRQRVERRAEHLFDVERATDGLGDRVEDLQVTLGLQALAHPPRLMPLDILASPLRPPPRPRTMSTKRATTCGSQAPASVSVRRIVRASAVDSAGL